MTVIYKLRWMKTDNFHPQLSSNKIIYRDPSLDKIIARKLECEAADARLKVFMMNSNYYHTYEILVCDDERKSMPSNRRLQ